MRVSSLHYSLALRAAANPGHFSAASTAPPPLLCLSVWCRVRDSIIRAMKKRERKIANGVCVKFIAFIENSELLYIYAHIILIFF